MKTPTGSAARVRRAIKWKDDTVRQFDWSVGNPASLRLSDFPSDYRELISSLPPGVFRHYLKVIRPDFEGGLDADYVQREHVGRLDIVRRLRDERHRSFPDPLYPEPGGLLPWGYDRVGGLYCWLTDSSDPDAWKVIWCDSGFRVWDYYEGSMCEFIVDFIRGEVIPLDDCPVNILRTPAFHVSRPPFFRPAAGTEYPLNRPRPPRLGPKPFTTHFPLPSEITVVDEFDTLASVLGPVATPARHPDWTAIEVTCDYSFPPDYRNFIERFGAGELFGIRVLSPEGEGEFDMVAATESFVLKVPEPTLAFAHSRRESILTWGETVDGKYLRWRAEGDDPRGWSVMMSDPGRVDSFYLDKSFSSFILDYGGRDEGFTYQTFLS